MLYYGHGLAPERPEACHRRASTPRALLNIGRTLEAPIPKMSGLVKKISPFSKRNNPL